MATGHRRRRGPWYGSDRDRVRFERGVRSQFPGTSRRLLTEGPDAGVEYRLTIPVEGYPSRRIRILFRRRRPKWPEVTTDGPSESPHRYDDNSLCMWYAADSDDRRWIFADGLTELLVHIYAHLFCEAWWRERGKWLGPEIPHGEPVPR